MTDEGQTCFATSRWEQLTVSSEAGDALHGMCSDAQGNSIATHVKHIPLSVTAAITLHPKADSEDTATA